MLVNMNDLLLPAKEKGYGVGFFNAVNVEMARAVIETAEELGKSHSTAEILLPATELNVAEHLIPMAQKHPTGLRSLRSWFDLERCMEVLN